MRNRTAIQGDKQYITLDLEDAKAGETWVVDIQIQKPDETITSHTITYSIVAPVHKEEGRD